MASNSTFIAFLLCVIAVLAHIGLEKQCFAPLEVLCLHCPWCTRRPALGVQKRLPFAYTTAHPILAGMASSEANTVASAGGNTEVASAAKSERAGGATDEYTAYETVKSENIGSIRWGSV